MIAKPRTSKQQTYQQAKSKATLIFNNNKQLEEETISAQAREGSGAETSDFESSFERFWSAYPKKKARANALKVWLKLKPNEDLVVVILSALEQQKRSADWLKDNGQYIPYPATWLNGKRWEDENIGGNNNADCRTNSTDWYAGF